VTQRKATPGTWPAGRTLRPPSRRPDERRRRLLRRAVPALLIVVAAFAVGLAVGLFGGNDGEDAVRAYAKAWSRGDWAEMYAELDGRSRADTPLLDFARLNREALATATATPRSITTGKPEKAGSGRWRIPVAVRTRIFGTVRDEVIVDVDTTLDEPKITWARRLVFPGLRDDEQLTRRTEMAARGRLLARDRSVLAEGEGRTTELPDVAAQVVGQLGPIPEESRDELTALGFPEDATVGTSGLERIFDTRLAGLPSGRLMAGDRVLARARGRDGEDVRTTLDPELVRASTAALAGRYGAIVVLDPRDGAVLGYAGVPFSIVQPPGSTFKIVTTAAALETGAAKLTDAFEPAQFATLSGVKLANANDEVCGGTLEQAFAESCNSVFAPIGAKLGARRLVDYAERFGFNAPGAFPNVAESTIPSAGEIGDDLAVGSSAIGQGLVQATTLEMTDVAATIARRGVRPVLTLDLAQARAAKPGTGQRVISERTARRMDRLMRAVVREGTGTAAAIPGVEVAGKTGTAELRSREKTPPDGVPAEPRGPEDTDAWFVAYAPSGPGKKPRAAVGVMLVGAGAGGETAAPAARGVLAAALQRGRG
jgi:hypothetical protein